MAGGLRSPARRVCAVVAAVAAAATGLTLAVTAAPVAAQPHDPQWLPCTSLDGSRVERVELILALDKSGSLRNVDPNGTRRRRAVHGVVERLADLQSSVAAQLAAAGVGSGFAIDVALSAFDTESEIAATFAPVTPEHPGAAAIDKVVDEAGNTDYRPAIETALQLFEESTNARAATTCRMFVMFTDGILDPYDTATGRRPDLEERAGRHVVDLLADVCGADSGLRQYRQRFDGLGVATYVAVLRGAAFDRGAGTAHIDALARASKQAIMALTGHVDSPLLDGVAPAAGCEPWSGQRAGKVIEIEDIDALAAELASAVGEVWLAVRQPRIHCSAPADGLAVFEGEWPYVLAVRGRGDRRLCTLTPPLDGEVELTWHRSNMPPYLSWRIDGDSDFEFYETLTADDEALSFDLVSEELPESSDYRTGAGISFVADSAWIDVIAVWTPAPQPGWPDQPAEVTVADGVGFDLLERDRHVLETLVDCRVHQRATWIEQAGGVRAYAASLCELQAPPAGEFEILLEAAGREGENRLSWHPVIAGDDVASVSPVLGAPVILRAGEASVSLGAGSPVLDRAAVPTAAITDSVRVFLTWRAPDGTPLLEAELLTAAEIDVRPTAAALIECGAEAQVAAARRSPGGEWALIVDSGCRLLSPPQGAVRATVAGDVRGEAWALVAPPVAGEESWLTRDDVDLTPLEPDRALFVGVGHPELADLVGEQLEFTLVAARSGDSSAFVEPQRELRTVTAYLPIPRCATAEVRAVRFDAPASEGEASPERARAENLCEIDPPPNGSLDVRLEPVEASDPASPALEWHPKSGGESNLEAEPSGALTLDSAGEPLVVGAVSAPLPADRIGPIETALRVVLRWRSVSGHDSHSGEQVRVTVELRAPDLLVCRDTPRVYRGSSEVPEVPLVVETGCLLLAHGAGTVSLTEVNGSVAGLRWLIPQVSVEAGDADLPVRIETDGVLPNDPLNRTFTFELVATLSGDGDRRPGDRAQAELLLQFQRRSRLNCTGTPQIVGSPTEVPEGPLVVDTGCVLEVPAEAGEVTVAVSGGELAGAPWVVRGDVRLRPGDGDLPILIETAEPLPNRRYDLLATFELAATWRSPDGVEQSVGSLTASGGDSPEVAVALRARPDSAQAGLLAAALLIGGLLAGWLLLAGLGRHVNQLPRSGAYRVFDGKATATVTPGQAVELKGFDLDQILRGESEPLIRRRGRLRAGDLTIRLRRRWWNPSDLLGGGRAAVVPKNMTKPLVATAPSAGKPDSLPPSLAPRAVVVALESPTSVSKQDLDRRRARVWILTPSAGKQPPNVLTSVEGNLHKALRDLGRRLSGASADPDRPRTAQAPAPAAGRRPQPPRDSRPKG